MAYHRISDEGPPELAPFRVSPAAFREQIRYLRDRGYHTVSLAEWTLSIITRRHLPGKPLILTFDDGYKDFFAHAWPILREAQLQATIFVVTSRVGGIADWDPGGPRFALMDWDELRALQQSGNTIASHCHNHRDLTRLPDEAIAADGAEARDILRRQLAFEATSVAFPWGKSDPRVRRALAKCGYLTGLGLAPRPSSFSDDVLDLPRIEIFGEDDLDAFASKLGGERPKSAGARFAGGPRRPEETPEPSGGASSLRRESLERMAARIDRMIEELLSIKRGLCDRARSPGPLESNLELLFTQPLSGPEPIRLTPHQEIGPWVRVGFEGGAEVAFSVVAKGDERMSPWSRSLRLLFTGSSRWFSLDLILAHGELAAARHYQLGLSLRASRPLACRAVLRLWQKDKQYREIPLAGFNATPGERNYNLQGEFELPDPLSIDHDSDPIFLLLFDTAADIEIDLYYLNLYFS